MKTPAPYPGEFRRVASAKTAPARQIERGPDGAYPGSLGQPLEPEEKKRIRQTLAAAEGPLHLSQIAAKSDINFFNVAKQQGLATFVEAYLCSTREAEMSFSQNARGQSVFAGWSATDHGRDLVSKGLA